MEWASKLLLSLSLLQKGKVLIKEPNFFANLLLEMHMKCTALFSRANLLVTMMKTFMETVAEMN